MYIISSIDDKSSIEFSEIEISTKGITINTDDFEMVLHCGLADAEKLAHNLLTSIELYKVRHKR